MKVLLGYKKKQLKIYCLIYVQKYTCRFVFILTETFVRHCTKSWKLDTNLVVIFTVIEVELMKVETTD